MIGTVSLKKIHPEANENHVATERTKNPEEGATEKQIVVVNLIPSYQYHFLCYIIKQVKNKLPCLTK